MFASDPRGIGNYWVREENGSLVFGCEAKLNIEDVDFTSPINASAPNNEAFAGLTIASTVKVVMSSCTAVIEWGICII